MKKIGVPRNILFGVFSWFVPLGITFLITPIVVRGLGQEQFGLYALVQTFVAYSFTFNVGRALTKYISTYQASGETARIGEALSATLMVNLLVGGMSAGLLALCSSWLVVSLLKIPVPLQHEALLAFYLASATLLPLMLTYVYNAVPQALHRFDIYSLVMLGGSAFNTITNGIVVWLGYGVFAMLLWNLIGTILVCVIFAIYARVLLPEARVVLRVHRELLWGVVRFSAGVTVYQLLANVLLLFERSWIARTLGTEAVTYYVVPMTVAIYIHAFVGSMALVIFPLTSEANAMQDVERLRLIYTRAIKYISLMVFFLCVTLCVCGHELLATWMNSDIADHSSRVLAIQAIVFSVIAIGIVPWQMADGLGRPTFNALLVFCWLLVAIPLTIWLTPIWGIEGTAVARLASMLAVPVHAMLIERWALKRNLWGFWGRTIGTLAFAGVVAGVAEYFMLQTGLHRWPLLAVAIISGGLAYLGCLHLTRFISDDEQVWLRGFVMRAVTP
jgi:O-antigen/teichoic acid export membrane protein